MTVPTSQGLVRVQRSNGCIVLAQGCRLISEYELLYMHHTFHQPQQKLSQEALSPHLDRTQIFILYMKNPFPDT